MTHSSQSAPQTYAIVCLECRSGCLYAEMVQTAEPPQRCWLRPLWLKLVDQTCSELSQVRCTQTGAGLYDLHGSPDLLWPPMGVRVALDTEILPLLTAFAAEDASQVGKPTPEAKQQLHYFLHQLWQDQTSDVDH